MSAGISRNLDATIVLDSSGGTDIIECSVEETDDKHQFFKTPRSQLKRKCKENSWLKNQIISVKGFQFKNDNCQLTNQDDCSLSSSPKCKLQSDVNANKSLIEDSSLGLSTPKTVKRRDSKPQSAINRLLSSIQKTPDLPYLSKSKLCNVQRWLVENDFHTAQTSPFSNSERRSSLRNKRISTPDISGTLTKRKNHASSDSSSVDSEVKKVLVAVYGDDWRTKNVIKKSKTEPKRTGKIIYSTKTDIKSKAQSTAKTKPVRTVRRNILRNDILRRGLIDDKSVNLDNSLGVESLNDSCSSGDLKLKNNALHNKRRNGSSESSSNSWAPLQSVKKKKKMTLTKPTSNSSQKKNQRVAPVELENVKSKKTNSLDKKTPVKSFLASLSVSTPKRRCHPEAQDFKINFKTKKEELALKLFKLYNSEIFGNNLPDDMNFSWNIKLRGTAGYCYNKKITKSTGLIIRLSRIEFSTKIIDRADRLRDTLIHELCHAASWVIDGVLDGHGSVWTKWAQKAMERFPELPPIRRCHNYEIAAKYTYRCTGCGYSINRHSKSINIDRKRCGHCFGVLELFVNKKRRGKAEVPEFDSTRTLPAPNKFALFVKENYQNVKATRVNAKHAEIMKILSQQYAAFKNCEQSSNKNKISS